MPNVPQLDVLSLQLLIKDLYRRWKDGNQLDKYEKELLENLACTVEHYEKQIYQKVWTQ